jgi:benzoyl-CoA oxygenase B subunit
MISAERIPNNVGLSSNKRLQRALEHWQPKYIQWWKDMGPQGFQDYHQVYVRTAVSVDPSGWAHFEYVKLPEYRWGIFLADPVHDRRIGFGDFLGKEVWQEVPGEFRNQLRRLVVTQGDTEPASVEQQRWLGQRCPSLYDLRNLFQVNVEEGRPSLGDGLPAALVLRARRPRRGGGTARAPERQSRQAAHPRRLQRADRELARLLHVHRCSRIATASRSCSRCRELARSRCRGRRGSC